MAQERSSKHLLEIMRTHKEAFYQNVCLPIVAMSLQSYSKLFGMPLSLHKWWSLRGFDKVVTWITIWLFGRTCSNEEGYRKDHDSNWAVRPNTNQAVGAFKGELTARQR